MYKSRVIISNEPCTSHPEYFKRQWRIPFYELRDIGWTAIDKHDINKSKSLLSQITKVNKLKPSEITHILFWNCHSYIKKYKTELYQYPNITKMVYIDDLHNDMTYKLHLFSNMNIVLATYKYLFPSLYSTINIDKIYWFPHNINGQFMPSEINKDPINKILLSGATSDVYPMRCKLKKYIKTGQVEQLQKQGYKVKNHDIIGKKYIQHLSEYICAFTCCSNINTPYLVAKFFEIPGSGSLLLAYDEFIKEHLCELGLIDGENYISVNHDNLKEKIDYILNPDNRKYIDSVRTKGYLLIQNNHTLKKRVDDLNKYLDEK